MRGIFIAFAFLPYAASLVSGWKSSVATQICRRKLSMTAAVDETTMEQQYLQIKEGVLAMVAGKENSENLSDTQKQFITIFSEFLEGYTASCLEAKESPENFKISVYTLLKTVQAQGKTPFKFEPYHQAVRAPFDYYTWGNNFMRPLIIDADSKLHGVENFHRIQELLSKGENVVILSNHQTEADAQVFSILLEREKAGFENLAEKSIFIAGHKVTNDPIAIPFSMGRNLICIHSKKHIKNPPEDQPRKSSENLMSMTAMGELMSKGGHLFWVAPSGGRDRPDAETKRFVVSPFDVKAIDMFKLMAMQSKKPLHFFPMAMHTNKLIPPPDTVLLTACLTKFCYSILISAFR